MRLRVELHDYHNEDLFFLIFFFQYSIATGSLEAAPIEKQLKTLILAFEVLLRIP